MSDNVERRFEADIHTYIHDALLSFLKNNIEIYVKIYIKTAPTCFGAVTPSSESALFVLTKVKVMKTVR